MAFKWQQEEPTLAGLVAKGFVKNTKIPLTNSLGESFVCTVPSGPMETGLIPLAEFLATIPREQVKFVVSQTVSGTTVTDNGENKPVKSTGSMAGKTVANFLLTCATRQGFAVPEAPAKDTGKRKGNGRKGKETASESAAETRAHADNGLALTETK